MRHLFAPSQRIAGSPPKVAVDAGQYPKGLIAATLGKNWMPGRVSIVKENLDNFLPLMGTNRRLFLVDIEHTSLSL